MARAEAINVQKFLKGIDYPANRNKLVQQAKKNKADKNIITILENLKEDAFNSPAEVSKAVGSKVGDE